MLNCTLKSTNQCIDIMQPAVAFGGVPPRAGMKNYSYIGELKDYTPLLFADTVKDLTKEMAMDMDAAIAYVGPNNSTTRRSLLAPFFILGKGEDQKITSIYNISDNIIPKMKVWTVTANSPSRKYCEVLLTNVVKMIKIEKKFMLLKEQILVKLVRARPGDTFFRQGDSGSLGVLDTPKNEAFGMLVSIEMVSNTPTDKTQALFTPIKPILDRFKVTLAKPTDGVTEK